LTKGFTHAGTTGVEIAKKTKSHNANLLPLLFLLNANYLLHIFYLNCLHLSLNATFLHVLSTNAMSLRHF